jgi:lipoprotein-anchoring transpeptidase ErfK/SrfK
LADYYSILSRSVGALNPNTAQARAALFARARDMLIDQIEKDRERWTNDTAMAEVAKFDTATDRIEAEIAQRARREPAGRSTRYRPIDDQPPPPPDDLSDEPKRGIGQIIAFAAAGLMAVFLAGIATYALLGRSTTTPQATAPKAPASAVAKGPEAKKTAPSRPALDGDDLEPGVDGGSTDAGMPYHLRRQAVYYRSVYSPGMLVIDRSQRFLYLVQPQARALRYAIGVGGECDIGAGLYRIKSKSQQWPEWMPSPAMAKRRNYPAKLPGGPGNPLGAYVLYFESDLPGIHGTNAPRSIGQAPTLGCFRMINDDVADLEKRIAVGTGVVVLN